MPRLINKELDQMLTEFTTFQKTFSETIYNQYKEGYLLTMSLNFRGGSSDDFKNYMANVPLNFINTFLNISEEMKATLLDVNKTFLEFESNADGIVGSGTLKNIRTDISKSKDEFNNLSDEITKVNSKASEYISLTSLSTQDVLGTFNKIETSLVTYDTGLNEANAGASTKIQSLSDRINEFSDAINKISNDYHTSNGIDYSKVAGLSNESWFKQEKSDYLKKLKTKDPFAKSIATDASFEEQWAVGLASDTYAYGGVRILGYSYENSLINGKVINKGDASVLDMVGHAQLTKWANLDANGQLIYAGYVHRRGFGTEYTGLAFEGNVGLAKGEASAVLGGDAFNGFVKAGGNVLTGDVNLNLEVEGNGDFNIGAGAEGVVVDGSVSGGLTLWGIDNPDSKNESLNQTTGNKTTTMLGVEVSLEGGIGAGIGAGLSSTTVEEYGILNLRVNNIKLEGKLFAGAEVNLKFPSLWFW